MNEKKIYKFGTTKKVEEIEVETIATEEQFKGEIISITPTKITAIHHFDGKKHDVIYEALPPCMSCGGEYIWSGQSGGCPVCEGLMTVEEYEKATKKSIIEEIQIDDIQIEEVKVAKVPTIPSKREVKIEQKKRSSNLTNIFVFVGPKGSGKTKSASDFIKLLKPNKRMAYFDSEFKADKIIDNWHKGKPVDILNFTIVDPITYKTKKTETLEEFEKEFQAKWIPKLKSGLYQYLVIDKGNVFWKMGEEYYYRITPNPPPAQFAWGKIYAIVLEKIFDALVNCCRINGIDLILCFNIKRAYKNDKQVGYKADVDSNEELLGFADYYLWLEMDYERFILKHPLKPFWRIVDEDLNVTDYLFNREFILETGELTIGNKTYKREFKRYVDFLEDTMLSTNKLQKRKQLIEEVDLGEEN